MLDTHFEIFINISKEWESLLNNITDKEEYKKLLEMFKWKVIHSARVSTLCKEIAIKEEFDDIIPSMEEYMIFNKKTNKYILNNNAIYIASLCGLYHDIGRFAQIVKFHTEDDSKSINHGILGYNLLNNNGAFKNTNLTDKDKNIILQSIVQHNSYSIYEDNPYYMSYFVNLVRDADKIDIIKGLVENKIQLLDIDNIQLSNEVIADIINEKMVLNSHIKSFNDRIARMFSFYYDIKTDSAKRIIEDDELFMQLYDKIEHKKYFDIILNSKILKRGKNNVR